MYVACAARACVCVCVFVENVIVTSVNCVKASVPADHARLKLLLHSLPSVGSCQSRDANPLPRPFLSRRFLYAAFPNRSRSATPRSQPTIQRSPTCGCGLRCVACTHGSFLMCGSLAQPILIRVTWPLRFRRPVCPMSPQGFDLFWLLPILSSRFHLPLPLACCVPPRPLPLPLPLPQHCVACRSNGSGASCSNMRP